MFSLGQKGVTQGRLKGKIRDLNWVQHINMFCTEVSRQCKLFI